MLYSQQAIDFNVTTNIIDGLISFDNYGKPVPALAKSWEHNEDSTVWTFHLRDDVDWVDCNGEVKEHITATDFLVGLEWVLNASKNEANNTSMPTLYIVGAEEYYEKTKDMGAAAATCAIRICWTQAWASRLPTTTLWCSPASTPAPTLIPWPPTPASTPPLRC